MHFVQGIGSLESSGYEEKNISRRSDLRSPAQRSNDWKYFSPHYGTLARFNVDAHARDGARARVRDHDAHACAAARFGTSSPDGGCCHFQSVSSHG